MAISCTLIQSAITQLPTGRVVENKSDAKNGGRRMTSITHQTGDTVMRWGILTVYRRVCHILHIALSWLSVVRTVLLI